MQVLRSCLPHPFHPTQQPNHQTSLPALLLQVLRELADLEVADLSFNIYMEVASSLLLMLDREGDDFGIGLASIRRLDLRQAREHTQGTRAGFRAGRAVVSRWLLE